MAFCRIVAASVLLVCLLLHLTEEALAQHQPTEISSSIHGAPAPSPVPQTIDCGVACEGRCKLTKRRNLCKRACGSCCAKCKCVPPGTSGHHDSCPCYKNLTIRNNIHKCP